MSTATAQADAAATKKRGPMLLVALLMVVVGAAGAWFFLGGDAEAAAPDESADGPVVALEPQTTTLGEAGLQHARVGVAVVLAEDQDPTVVEEHAPLLKDALITELSEISGDELRSSEGSAALREALSGHAREIWGEEVVHRVVLTELLVQ